jgi:hypothetical protein
MDLEELHRSASSLQYGVGLVGLRSPPAIEVTVQSTNAEYDLKQIHVLVCARHLGDGRDDLVGAITVPERTGAGDAEVELIAGRLGDPEATAVDVRSGEVNQESSSEIKFAGFDRVTGTFRNLGGCGKDFTFRRDLAHSITNFRRKSMNCRRRTIDHPVDDFRLQLTHPLAGNSETFSDHRKRGGLPVAGQNSISQDIRIAIIET